MDGVNGTDVFVAGSIPVEAVVVDRDERGLPVVAVDDVGLEAVQFFQMLDGVQNGAGEEREPLGIVIIPVQAGALEVVLVVQQVIGDAVCLRFEHAAVLSSPGNGDVEVQKVLHLGALLLGDRTVKRQDDADIFTFGLQSFGQSARDFGETAADGKGDRFTGSKQDIHKNGSSIS